MRISFVIPDDNLSGGIKVVARYANALQQRGHDVLVVGRQERTWHMSRWDKLRARFRGTRTSAAPGSHFESSHVEMRLIPPGRPFRANDLPDADVVIATWWSTAEFVLGLPKAKGRKCYLIQHHEIHPHQPLERVRATLRSPMQKIVVSRWLKELMAREYGDTSAILVPNGVDSAHFHAEPRARAAVPTVGYLYHRLPYKGSDIAIEAIRLARRQHPELRSIAFGRDVLGEGPPDPDLSDYFFRPEQSAIPGIYAACDVWLFASRLEGYGLPLLEAAACGTPIVATPAGAAPELIAAGAGVLVEAESPTAMAEGIERILGMPAKDWAGLSLRCVQIAREHDWANSENAFEAALMGLLR